MWILAAKLPNSDLNFAVDFWWILSSYFFQGKRPKKIHQKIPPQNSLRTLFGKIPLGFLQKQGAGNLTFCGPVLRDTARLSQRHPPIARYGVFGVATWPIGCDTPAPFSERFPHEEHAKWRFDTPPSKGVSQRYPMKCPMKTRQMGAIPPSAILSRKGIACERVGPVQGSKSPKS